MTTRRLLLAAVVAAIAATTILLGGVLRRESAQAGAGIAVADVAGDRLQAGFGAGSTTGLIASIEQALRERPRDARARNPLPQFVGALGDLYRLQGRETAAREQFRLVAAIERLLVANGVRTELETAQFNLDHGVRIGQSLELAKSAHRARPSIVSDDLLAWALERNGRCGTALRHSRRALRLGTRDAMMFFHRGMIERCLGREGAARAWFGRALRLNPHFSLIWAPVARKALA